MGRHLVILALATVWAVTPARSAFSASPSLGWRLSYGALYESNIYHAFADTTTLGTLVNTFSAQANWRSKQARHIQHRFDASGEFEQYTSYSNRNQGSFALSYAPIVRYARHGRLSLDASVSRRSKDLIDDSGQSLSRTLKRWETGVGLMHRYDIGRLRAEQSLGYSNLNYDERDSVASGATGETLVHLLSYDYNSAMWGLAARYDVTRHLEVKLSFDVESRDYRERRTYTVQYGATIGRPFSIRSFRENTVGTELRYRFDRNNELRLDVDYTNRIDNFENFYGYIQRQYKLSLTLHTLADHHTTVSFRYKNKDYPNYYTRAIGIHKRVHVDYADFQLEHEYRLTDTIAVNAYVRNFNKTSNDSSFDYQDLTAGMGLTLDY